MNGSGEGRIKAVLFDLGGTLEDVRCDEQLQRGALAGFRRILDRHDLNPAEWDDRELLARLEQGMREYKAWREQSEIELPPEEVWRKYLLPDWRPTDGARAGEELAYYYDLRFFSRTMRPETPRVLAELRAAGFRLGLISNVLSRELVPRQLEAYGIADAFSVVLTSAGFGRRKPHPAIFLEAARRLGVEPAQSAYVGDTVSRDVAGARRAGYALAIQIRSFLTGLSDNAGDRERPDALVRDLTEVAPLVRAAEAA